MFEARHSVRSKQDIPGVRSKTFRVFEAKHFLCSTEDISCVRSKTFRVFEARHCVCSKQDIPCVRSKTFLVFERKHSLCSKQDIPCVANTDFVSSKHQQCTCHFLVNSTNRPRIWGNRNQIRPNPGTIGRIRQKMACKISNFEWLKNREDSSDFDDFLTKMIASTRSIFSKIFARPKNFSRRRKNSI